jgi:hypothetical protein
MTTSLLTSLQQLYSLQDVRHQGSQPRHQLAGAAGRRGSQVLYDLRAEQALMFCFCFFTLCMIPDFVYLDAYSAREDET